MRCVLTATARPTGSSAHRYAIEYSVRSVDGRSIGDVQVTVRDPSSGVDVLGRDRQTHREVTQRVTGRFEVDTSDAPGSSTIHVLAQTAFNSPRLELRFGGPEPRPRWVPEATGALGVVVIAVGLRALTRRPNGHG